MNTEVVCTFCGHEDKVLIEHANPCDEGKHYICKCCGSRGTLMPTLGLKWTTYKPPGVVIPMEGDE